MLYEVDFHPVGDGESSGDAICLRFSSDEGNTWTVGVIDGGTQDSGEAICSHIRKYYGTGTVDFMVWTVGCGLGVEGLGGWIGGWGRTKITYCNPW